MNIGNQYVADGYEPVSWNFATMPSEEWKNGVGSALTTYAADQTDANWDARGDRLRGRLGRRGGCRQRLIGTLSLKLTL